MKKFCFVVVVLLLCSLSFAETPASPANSNTAPQKKAEPAQPVSRSIFSTDTCSFNFATGSNNTLLTYCVTANGNILNIQTPQNQTHVFGREGYGFCDINSNTEYFDYADAGDTSNWSAPVTASHSATKVKITRSTSDGIWLLTQTIALVPASSSIKVTMTLKNNTAVSREVQLVRFADIDANGHLNDTIDSTINDAMIYESIGRGSPFGLTLQNIGTSPFTYLGYIQDVPFGVTPCTPFTHHPVGPITDTDGSAVMTYVITIPAGATRTVNVGYRGL